MELGEVVELQDLALEIESSGEGANIGGLICGGIAIAVGIYSGNAE